MLLALSGLSRRLTEVGYLVGGLGALIIAYGAYSVIRGNATRESERWATVVGILLVGLAFGLQLIGLVSAPKLPAPSPTPSTISSSPTPSASSSP